ncbi:hypothetical protein VU06_02810, partial [Desulfobulbus sp. F3]|nr:hypothetical protein [Desulfobulbus sp. F3]
KRGRAFFAQHIQSALYCLRSLLAKSMLAEYGYLKYVTEQCLKQYAELFNSDSHQGVVDSNSA